MKVYFCNYSLGNFIQNRRSNNNLNHSFSSTNVNNFSTDSFIRSSKEISFNGTENKKNTKDVLSDLALIGIIGAPFVLSIGAATYAMNKMNPEEIFLPDGTYFMSVDQMKTDTITANASEGILKVEGTPIDIDANRYDLADIEHGIFKNFDGSVDIDLAHNKFIDLKNGIIIDPENKLSFIKDGSGVIHNLVLPDLNSPNFEGSSIGIYNLGHSTITRQEYIQQHGSKPENDLSHIYSGDDRIPHSAMDRIVDPNDNRTLAQKIVPL